MLKVIFLGQKFHFTLKHLCGQTKTLQPRSVHTFIQTAAVAVGMCNFLRIQDLVSSLARSGSWVRYSTLKTAPCTQSSQATVISQGLDRISQSSQSFSACWSSPPYSFHSVSHSSIEAYLGSPIKQLYDVKSKLSKLCCKLKRSTVQLPAGRVFCEFWPRTRVKFFGCFRTARRVHWKEPPASLFRRLKRTRSCKLTGVPLAGTPMAKFRKCDIWHFLKKHKILEKFPIATTKINFATWETIFYEKTLKLLFHLLSRSQ